MATVRIFSYPGLVAATLFSGANRPVTDAVFMYREPYLAGELLSPDTSTPATSSVNTAPAETSLLRVQVDGGKRVHYEITAKDQELRVATINSPIVSGDEMMRFAPEWRISLLEVTE